MVSFKGLGRNMLIEFLTSLFPKTKVLVTFRMSAYPLISNTFYAVKSIYPLLDVCMGRRMQSATCFVAVRCSIALAFPNSPV